jgi:predicted Zn-dependent protease
MPSDVADGGPWAGRVTDGRTARAHDVAVSLGVEGLKLTRPGGDGHSAIWRYDGLSSAVPLARGAPEALLFSSQMPGASLFVAAPGFVDALRNRAPNLTLAAARLSGLKPGLAVGALAFSLAAAVYAFDLSPSKGIARLMPEAARERLGDTVMRSFADRRRCTEPAGQAALDALVVRLVPDGSFTGRVAVLDWQLVNAFAAPGRRVVLTRAIVQRATSPDELAGVLAHELGHGRELHPEAGLVRSVGFWALIQMVFTGTPGAVGNAGTMLLQLAYTRSSEREADDQALVLLKRAGISAKPFAAFFQRMDRERRPSPVPASIPGAGRLGSDLFSTHPNTPERIAKIERQEAYPSTPALTAEQWRDLKEICGAQAAPSPQPLPPPEAFPSPVGQSRPSDGEIKKINDRLAARPDEAFNWQARAVLRLRLGDRSGALADYHEAVRLAPNNAPFRYQRGRLHAELGDNAKALADFGDAVRLNPSSAASFAARGDLHRREGRFADALTDLDTALRLSPTFVAALYNRGQVHAEQRRWAPALADFSAAIETDPRHTPARVGRGQVYEQLGQKEQAIADYRAVIAAPPPALPESQAADALARRRLAALGHTP